jgi:hypothetical protein
VGEFIEVAIHLAVAYPVGALCRCGVDKSVAETLFKLLLEVTAVDGVVDGGAGGSVD